MSEPQRVQLRRSRGFRLQEESLALNGLPAVKVDRSAIFGNPCGCSWPHGCPYSKDFDRAEWEREDGTIHPLRCCVDVYRYYLETGLRDEPTTTGRLWFALEGTVGYPHRKKLIAALPKLRGKNLACWCSGKPCHADVLLELANA